MNLDQTRLDQPLDDADWDRLEAILTSLGDRAELDLEGLDGLIAANACGPRKMRPLQVLATAFVDGEMPEFASATDLQDFMSLSLRRNNEYVRFFSLAKRELTVDNVIVPALAELGEEETAPARDWSPDAATARSGVRRQGRWPGQAWARGFMRAHWAYPDSWDALSDSEDGPLRLAPLMMLDVGYNPDQPSQPFDPETWMAMLPLMLRDIDKFYRDEFVRDMRSREPYRAPPKVGRNDPCPCGSGRKYKHCCGAAS